jgi:hypothetical protein
MSCIFCYASPVLISNAKTKTRKGLISYNNANGIIALKKHVHANHSSIVKIFEEVNNLLKEPYEKQPTKKRPHVNGTIISNFFVATIFYEKYDMHQK